MKDKNDLVDEIDFTGGSIASGIGLIMVLVMYLSGGFKEYFQTIKGVAEAIFLVAIGAGAGYFIFIIGVIIYCYFLKKLEFLKYPALKGIAIILLLTAAAWLMCKLWGPEGWNKVIVTTY